MSNRGGGSGTDSLLATWTPALGDLDSYRLLLSHGAQLVLNESVPANATSHRLRGLTPGAPYRLQLVTLSGGLASKPALAEGRTGNTAGISAQQTSKHAPTHTGKMEK